MKKWIISIIVILVAGAAAWFFLRKKEKPVALETENPAYGYIASSVTATGTVQPVDTVAVGAQISGNIQSVYADFNSTVKKGQLIAQIDKSLLQAQVNQNIAGLDQAKSNLQYQQNNYNRQNLLYKTDAISKADYETALDNFNTAKAAVANAQAQLQAAQKNLSFTDIYSPIDGVVLTRNVSVGQTVASSFNTPTLFVIAKDLTKMQVRANIDEADIGNVQKQQRTTFSVDAFPNDVFNGTVEDIRLEPAVSANVVTYTTIIGAPNDKNKLKPGMTANITVYTKEIDSALLISVRALKFKPDSATMSKQFIIQPLVSNDSTRRKANAAEVKPGVLHVHDSTFKKHDSTRNENVQRATVWVMHGDTLIQKRILIGLNDGTHAQVIHGLSTTDEVITGEQAPDTKGSKTPGSSSGQAPKSPFMPQRPGGGGRGR